jgi:hypothetical protein
MNSIGFNDFFINFFLPKHKITKLKKKKNARHIGKKKVQARGPSSPTYTPMPNFILFNFLSGRLPRFF